MSAKRVLIVDDTKEIARLLQAALSTLDAELKSTVVPSAEEAILEITRQAFDLLVIDVRLPGISGLELTRKLRSRNKKMHVIQISGLNDPSLKDQAMRVGADMFMPKPLVMSEFLATVERLLDIQRPPSTDPLVVQPATASPEVQTVNLPDILASVRQSLNALAVGLADERGRMIARAGDFPDPSIETSIVPALLASLSASEKVSRLMSQDIPANLVLVRGPELDFVAAPAGLNYMALVVLKRARSGIRLALAVDELLAAQKDLRQALAQSAVTASPAEELEQAQLPQPVEPPPLVQTLPVEASPDPHAEELAVDLEELFNKTETARLTTDDVNAFWDKLASGKDTGGLSNPDMLSYDQASRLGLTPDGEET